MAGSINKVILIGNVGKDPEVRNLSNGNRVASLTLATSESWKDKQTGERKEKTEWHRVSVFSDPLVNIIEKYVSKGSKIYIEGQLQTRKWTDKEGVEKYSTEVVLQGFNGSLTLLDGPSKEGRQAPQKDPRTRDDGTFNLQGGGPPPRSQRSFDDTISDEIPFSPEFR